MSTTDDFAVIHARLKKIVQQFEGKGLNPSANTATDYLLTGPQTPTSMGRDVWFGGVQIKKNYVSFHLMAVYMFPDLLENISPELKKRMQGKSCFNFKKVDEALFNELEILAKKSYNRLIKETFNV